MVYDILIIDAPWKQYKGIRKVRPNQKKEFDYLTMSIDDIFLLLDKKIFPLANQPNVVFMWCIEKYINKIDKYMFERGYKKHTTIIWDKTNGIPSAFTIRFSHEYIVWYYQGNLIEIDKNVRGKFLSVFREKSRQHSRKPDFAYNMIREMYPNQKKIDVFAREKREDFDVWGNEVDKFDVKSNDKLNIQKRIT